MIAIRSMTASHEHEPWGTWPDSAPHFAGCQGRRSGGTARSDVMCGSDVAIDGKAGDRVITADSAPQSLTNFLQRCDNQALDATQDDWRGYQ